MDTETRAAAGIHHHGARPHEIGNISPFRARAGRSGPRPETRACALWVRPSSRARSPLRRQCRPAGRWYTTRLPPAARVYRGPASPDGRCQPCEDRQSAGRQRRTSIGTTVSYTASGSGAPGDRILHSRLFAEVRLRLRSAGTMPEVAPASTDILQITRSPGCRHAVDRFPMKLNHAEIRSLRR